MSAAEYSYISGMTGLRLALSGASEPRNLGYMERLGLWGEGTPSFAAFQDFLDAVGGRGVGALELVAMDMKARGMFVCRTLSFQGRMPLLLHAEDVRRVCAGLYPS